MCGAIIGSGWAGLDESYLAVPEFEKTGVSSPFSCFFHAQREHRRL
jgi:3-oxoacyl-[acyl-carrier-protein] synthase II